MAHENKYKSWLVTLSTPEKEKLVSEESLLQYLEKYCDEYVYQLEKNPDTDIEKFHYQVYLKTQLRTRKTTLLNSLSSEMCFPKEYIRAEKMLGTREQAILYCSKKETACLMPTYSPNIRRERENLYEGKDLQNIKREESQYPWQREILKKIFISSPFSIKDPDDREIMWVMDEKGNSGKSKLVKYLCVSNESCIKLPFGTASQLRSSIVNAGPRRVYILDIPRTLGVDDNIDDLISVIEDVKNGFVVSSFYGNYGSLVIEPPHVIIFSNRQAPISKMSEDRWRVWGIVDNELVYYPGGYMTNINDG